MTVLHRRRAARPASLLCWLARSSRWDALARMVQCLSAPWSAVVLRSQSSRSRSPRVRAGRRRPPREDHGWDLPRSRRPTLELHTHGVPKVSVTVARAAIKHSYRPRGWPRANWGKASTSSGSPQHPDLAGVRRDHPTHRKPSGRHRGVIAHLDAWVDELEKSTRRSSRRPPHRSDQPRRPSTAYRRSARAQLRQHPFPLLVSHKPHPSSGSAVRPDPTPLASARQAPR